MEEALRMFLALNSLLSVNGRILRIPCMIDAVFDVVFFDKRLQGNGLAVFNSIDDQGCTLKCAENHKCTSYNYQWMDKTCEIHQKHVQQDNSTDLLDANGWIFKTTNYSNKLIGPTCNSLKPCDPEDLCLDTCSPPFYECIHCQSLYPELKCIKQADVDACASNPCKHASQCLNKSSDYECTCLEGYTGKICDIDIDECASLPCFNGGTCSNQIGNFVCQCFQGYTGIHCEQDIDECLDGAHQCHTKAYCKNTFGSLYCECWAGYSGDGIKSCIDVNECLVSTHNCHTNADCTNTDGSFNCNCQTGYSGNGVTCADINECTDGTHNCHADALCTNTVGSFYCTCNDGYAGSGIACSDINECTDGTHNCHADALCTNTVCSFYCTCNDGYAGNGIACSDIDECTTGVHGCPLQTQCINKAGMFICTANMAYKKPSKKSSQHIVFGIDLVSEFGNDGNRNGAWEVCAFTATSPPPWWQVDLVNRVHIGMVIIRSGTTFGQWKINPFSISVGDDETNGGRSNPLCVSDQTVVSGEVKEMHCGQPLLGRYVSVFIDREENLQVCELEVYQGVSLANKISCVDWYRVGAKNNGIYAISDKTGLIHHVYCDFSSEPNFVWTLVTSFSLANNYLFKNKPLYENDPISEYEPNWNSYRLGFSVMDYVSSVSTHWRATCSYPGYGVDYRDYVRAKLSEINPLTYKDSICKLVELINIRGHNATNQWVSFWQDTELFLHTDSDLNHCFLLAKEGSVASEDNFGYHETINKDFSCTEASTSTTQYWFGVSV
ncbi:transmembrane cell adhesion receptor mua-3-like isoform X9 [Rhopilema esculentum]|uniref:transmembrane cell adhesion receptor mua-3-like isoform X9 n=1 Tax=Rhopilema esculentum TaxID=499914 RepID=UPI0031E3403B